MKRIIIPCLIAVVAIVGCGKPKVDDQFKPMFKDRAIVVLRDDKTGRILQVDTFSASDLTNAIVYTNGPSVRFVCFGDLVHPEIPKMQISGDKIEMQCQDGQIMTVLGNTLMFEPALNTAFLEQVEEELANKKVKHISKGSNTSL